VDEFQTALKDEEEGASYEPVQPKIVKKQQEKL